MRKTLMFVVFTVFTILFSAQFEIVKDVTELQNDLTAAKYGYKDVNGDWCAILKVHTDIKDLQFEGMGYEKHDYWAESGIYIVYLQPETKNIRFIKDEFIALNHDFPFKLKGNSVYQIDIKGVGEEKKIENIIITIQTVPSGGEIYFDGENLGFIEQIETAVGPHELTVKRSGYEDKTTNIQVSAKNNFFKIDLEPLPETIQLNTVKPVDYSGSGMTFSIETGIPYAGTLENIFYGDSVRIEVSPKPGIGFSVNTVYKLNRMLDVNLKIRLITFYEPLVSVNAPLLPLSYFFEGAQGNLHAGLCYKLPYNIGLFYELGLTKIFLRYKYDGEDDDHQYDSWDFSYSYGISFTHKRFDFKVYNNQVHTETDVFKNIGLSAGYKFWIF